MNRTATLAFTPLSALYGVGVRLRNRLYRHGILRSFSVDVPVISVGNLTTGGTGKTPLVAWIAGQLAAKGYKVCVLTRGYGRNSAGRVIVSDYSNVQSDVRAAGDEPFWLAQNLLGRASVICDSDRVTAARWAKDNLGCDAFVLDDGFQHRRITRALNILTVDATNPWGNGRLVPAGILREPTNEIARADCIVLTRADETTRADELRAEIAHSSNVPVFTSQIKFQSMKLLSGTALEDHQKRRFAAFCGIGNPGSFFSLLRRTGHEVVYTAEFRDHQIYTQPDIDGIVAAARGHGADVLVTTAKDAVKLRELEFGLPCHVLETSIDIQDAERFFSYIQGVVAAAS